MNGDERGSPPADSVDDLATSAPPVADDKAVVRGDYGWYVGPAGDADRYELIGAGLTGGEGTTWEARYRGRLSRPLRVAVKQLRPPAGADDWPSDQDVQTWNDQRHILAAAHVPHVVAVQDVFVGATPHRRGDLPASMFPYVVMEWVPGRTLAEHVGGKPATTRTLPGRLVNLEEIAGAVAALHSMSRTQGNPMLHRDIKPANCIVDPERGAVLVDVSTMRQIDAEPDRNGLHSIRYAAPEVVADPTAARAPSSDVFSLGALALFLVLGADPPENTTETGCLDEVRKVVRQAGSRDAERFTGLLAAAVAAQPSERPVDIPRWAAELRSLVPGPSTRSASRPSARRLAAIGAAALIAATAVGYGLLRPSGEAVAGKDFPIPPTTASDAVTASTASSPIGTAAPTPAPAGPAGAASASSPPVTPPVDGSIPPEARPAATAGGPSSASATRIPVPPPASRAAPTVASRGVITTPSAGSAVQSCAYFSGTAQLPSGKRLLLGMSNLSNDDPHMYLENTTWSSAVTTGSWRGAQYFGSQDVSVGQRYRVTLLSIDTATAAQYGNDYPASVGTPSWATPLASVDIDRVTGTGPGDGLCPLS